MFAVTLVRPLRDVSVHLSTAYLLLFTCSRHMGYTFSPSQRGKPIVISFWLNVHIDLGIQSASFPHRQKNFPSHLYRQSFKDDIMDIHSHSLLLPLLPCSAQHASLYPLL